MKESVIIQKLIQVGQMLERGQLEYSGAEADTIYLLEQYAALRQPPVVGRSEKLFCPDCKGDKIIKDFPSHNKRTCFDCKKEWVK
jgi:hypothetical protein